MGNIYRGSCQCTSGMEAAFVDIDEGKMPIYMLNAMPKEIYTAIKKLI